MRAPPIYAYASVLPILPHTSVIAIIMSFTLVTDIGENGGMCWRDRPAVGHCVYED